jgi:alpha-galactosidase
VDPTGRAIEVYSGAHGDQCSWLAVRDSDGRGLLTGWEFDGRAKATVSQTAASGQLRFTANILDLYHPVAQSATFQMPAAFIGLFHGDWDEAGYRTQQFADKILAKPAPDLSGFPLVGWDSWGYQTNIDDRTLRREADAAAAMGVELFTVDLGWSRAIGDWYADPVKFPDGLRALSDYVHSLGMKFGLHFALTEAAPQSPVLQQNPDWAATDDSSYFGATSLCLSHQPARQWLVSEALRLIDDYNPDWIVQDGENMVKTCTKSTHTHDPLDSNYSNSVEGLNAAVTAIQQARPNVAWENCENGGNMMTFNMVRNYVTSITNDASGAAAARKAVFGATYPFPPRYADRYMPDEGLTPYVTNSYFFGGPWIIMQPLVNLDANQRAFLASQIQAYKANRAAITASKVYHLSAAPESDSIDAIQGYNASSDSAVAVVSRPQTASDSYLLKPQGLNGASQYRVWFDSYPQTYLQTGSQLMRDGITVPLPNPFSSEIVHFDKQ